MTERGSGARLERLSGDVPGWRWRHEDVTAVFTGRGGGVSQPPYDSCNVGLHVGDDLVCVLENRRRIAATCGLVLEDVAGVVQVHGTGVWIDATDTPSTRALAPGLQWGSAVDGIEADALVTTSTDRGLAIGIADCMPIAIGWGEAIAVVHAGWRGLVGGVLEQAMDALREATGIAAMSPDARAHRAVIGPSLCADCFEVGEEVASQFSDADVVCATAGARPHVDARRDARRRLERAGVTVDVVDECTRCAPGCFSHRGDGGVTGRQALLAWRASSR